MNFDGILQSLPQCDFAFAYGSGVFEQKGYENAKSAPMVDFVVATQDSTKWHAENIQRNPGHYSSLRFLGPKFVSHVQESYGAGLYYNTLVPLPAAAQGAPNQKMKYGVISLHQLLDDLLHWRTMYISGRMHKPVRIVHCTHEPILQAARENLRNALRAALLMLPASFTAEELFMAIASLSYTGDFRMVFGENPNKVANIVTKNMEHFHRLYDPVLDASFPNVSKDKTVSGQTRYTQDLSPEATLALGMSLPFHLQQRMATAFFEGTELGKSAMYLSFLTRLRKSPGNTVPRVLTLREFIRSRVGRPAFGSTQTTMDTAILGSAVDAGLRQPPRDLDGSASSDGVHRLREMLKRVPGARAVAFAEAGREIMQRMRNQRLQYLVAKRDRKAERLRGKTTDGLSQDRVTRETLKHFIESESPLGTHNYALAAQTPQIVAFWDEMLKADPRASKQIFPVLSRRSTRFTAAEVSKIAQQHLRPAISHIVGSSARTQSIKGIVTAGPVRATIYAWQKLEKFFKATISKLR